MVSVIIPVYNGEKYIAEAIESVLVQSYKDYEVVVVDDGSTDETAAIVSQYPVRYIYQNNLGEAAARNKGIDCSTGEYITFCDADDVYKLNKLQRQVELLKSFTNVDVVYSSADLVDENLKYIDTLKPEFISDNKEDFLAMMIFRQIIPCTPLIMFRRNSIKGKRYNAKYKQATDYDFTINLALKSRFKYIDESLYLYRQHNANVTKNHKIQVMNEQNITQSLGVDAISSIIERTSFNYRERQILKSKIFTKIEEFDEAIKILEKLNSSHYEESVCFYLANCYYEKNMIKEAANLYEKATLLNSFMAEAYNNLGCCLCQLNNELKGEMYFKKAITIRNNYMDAKMNLDSMKFKSKEYKITKRELRKTLVTY
jgi:glycosyltransferase involved in cell wall biosynthesis